MYYVGYNVANSKGGQGMITIQPIGILIMLVFCVFVAGAYEMYRTRRLLRELPGWRDKE